MVFTTYWRFVFIVVTNCVVQSHFTDLIVSTLTTYVFDDHFHLELVEGKY